MNTCKYCGIDITSRYANVCNTCFKIHCETKPKPHSCINCGQELLKHYKANLCPRCLEHHAECKSCGRVFGHFANRQNHPKLCPDCGGPELPKFKY